jgi:diguanylate cyclase (GGDEF)-like protein
MFLRRYWLLYRLASRNFTARFRRFLAALIFPEMKYDVLTGARMRYLYEAVIDRVEQHRGLGLVLVDVNNLKLTNDTFGYKAGDEQLKRAKAAISVSLEAYKASVSKRFRRWLHVYRIGGDEFVAFVPLDQAELIANCIQAEFGYRSSDFFERRFGKEAAKIFQVTVSVGFGAKFPEAQVSLHEDKAVYKPLVDYLVAHHGPR